MNHYLSATRACNLRSKCFHFSPFFLPETRRLFSRVPPCHWNVQVGVFFLMAFIRLKWKERGLEVSNLKPFLTSKGDSEPQKNFFYVDSRMKWNQSEVEKKFRSPSSFFRFFFKWAEIHIIVRGRRGGRESQGTHEYCVTKYGRPSFCHSDALKFFCVLIHAGPSLLCRWAGETLVE